INYFDIGLQWLPAHIWKGVADPAGFNFFDLAKGWPVTTGPWKVTRFTDNQVFMDRRPEWWAAKAGLAPMPAMERVITIPGGTRDRMVQMIAANQDRKSTRLNSSHLGISYAVFCLKKKKKHAFPPSGLTLLVLRVGVSHYT